MTTPSVSVVFPCLNERDSVGGCVEETLRAFATDGTPCEVIVADNGSEDGSPDVARAAGARVVHEPQRGYGAAVASAIAEARGQVIVTADADGTYPMEEAPALARRALDAGGIVLGSRFSGKIERGAMPFLHRTVGSPATRMLLRLLFGVRSSDPHSGMRAMRREVFEVVRPRSRGWEFTVEMLMNARRRGVDVHEMPIAYRRRIGESKLRALPQGWGFFRFLVLHSPRYLFVLPGLVTMVSGLALLVWLVPADRDLGRLNLGVNSLVVGALATIVGYQVLAFGVSARAHAAGHGRAGWPAGLTLERGLAAGAAVLAAGLGVVAWVAFHWWTIDFGPLPRSVHGASIVGLTCAVVGTQTIFSAFFLALLADQEP